MPGSPKIRLRKIAKKSRDNRFLRVSVTKICKNRTRELRLVADPALQERAGVQGACPPRFLNREMGLTHFALSHCRRLSGKGKTFSGCEDAPWRHDLSSSTSLATGRFTFQAILNLPR